MHAHKHLLCFEFIIGRNGQSQGSFAAVRNQQKETRTTNECECINSKVIAMQLCLEERNT